MFGNPDLQACRDRIWPCSAASKAPNADDSAPLIVFLKTQIETLSHFICPREWRLSRSSLLTVDYFKIQSQDWLRMPIYIFPISSGCWRCFGETPVDMPSSWRTWSVYTSRFTNSWLSVLQVLIFFLKGPAETKVCIDFCHDVYLSISLHPPTDLVRFSVNF